MLNSDEILRVACEVSGVSEKDILNSDRSPHIFRGRQLTAHLLHQHMGMGQAAIGRFLGKDHSTIANALKSMPVDDERWDQMVSVCNSRLAQRTVIQIISIESTTTSRAVIPPMLAALCSDGSLWFGQLSENPQWKQIPTP